MVKLTVQGVREQLWQSLNNLKKKEKKHSGKKGIIFLLSHHKMLIVLTSIGLNSLLQTVSEVGKSPGGLSRTKKWRKLLRMCY